MPQTVSRSRLSGLVDAFRGLRIAIVGDFVLDRFLHGRPKRISREAPVLILRYVDQEDVPGGGANTAANVASLGGVAVVAGAVGNDPEGESLRRLFAERGIDGGLLTGVDGYSTPTKTRILAGGRHSIKQQVVRIDREEPLVENGSWSAALRQRVVEAAAAADVLVLADYGYGSARPEWIGVAKSARPKLPVLVDSRFRLSEFGGADAATPNEEELEQAAGAAGAEDEAAFDATGSSLLSTLSARALLVTRGSRGMALFEAGEETFRVPVHGTDQVADVTGAGDTVMATFALALATGATFREAALLSNFAGGIVVLKMGTATVSADELKEAIASDRAILRAP
jgi:rfaE bifunctional protein kinase chain/domain